MQKKESSLTEQEIDTILNNELDENFWMFQLGISVSEISATGDNRFSFPFLDAGKKYWAEIKENVRELLCDTSKNEPKEITSDILSGDIRGITLYYFGLVISHFDYTAQVTIPLIALILKHGIIDFCSNK